MGNLQMYSNIIFQNYFNATVMQRKKNLPKISISEVRFKLIQFFFNFSNVAVIEGL